MSARVDMARARVGPLVLGVGMAMVAVAFVGYGADHNQHEAAAPPSPPSATSSPPAAKHAKPARQNRAARTDPGRGSDGGRVAAAGAPKTSTGGGGASPQRRPSTIAPSGPKPSPPAASPPVTTSCDVGVTVLVLNACLNLGDSP